MKSVVHHAFYEKTQDQKLKNIQKIIVTTKNKSQTLLKQKNQSFKKIQNYLMKGYY